LSSTQKDRSARLWFALDVEIEAAAREAVEYALMEAGALGTETEESGAGGFRVTAYFERLPDRESVRAELANALRIYGLASSTIREQSVREVEDQDWLGEWKKNWRPVEIGRLVIAPPWSDVRVGGDRVVIRIEPGMAFGTGTHETTRLCLKAIMRFFKGGSFLDVGTGTGILAIAAAKLFPNARISACDTDAAAVEIARENARLNGVEKQIDFRIGSLNALEKEAGEQPAIASADFVCANLTAEAIAPLLPALISASCGRLVLSGVLDMQVDGIVDQLHNAGASDTLIMMQDGEWVALIV
jgi:ribosomal protein L11 methyltransferase